MPLINACMSIRLLQLYENEEQVCIITQIPLCYVNSEIDT